MNETAVGSLSYSSSYFRKFYPIALHILTNVNVGEVFVGDIRLLSKNASCKDEIQENFVERDANEGEGGRKRAGKRRRPQQTPTTDHWILISSGRCKHTHDSRCSMLRLLSVTFGKL